MCSATEDLTNGLGSRAGFFPQKCCPQRWHYCFSTCLNGSLWKCICTSQQFLQRTDRHQMIVQHCQTSPICLVISEVRWRCGAHNKHLIWVTDLICDVCGELSSAQFYKQPCYAVLPPVWCVGWVAVSGWGVGKWRVLRTAISDKRGDLGCWHHPRHSDTDSVMCLTGDSSCVFFAQKEHEKAKWW